MRQPTNLCALTLLLSLAAASGADAQAMTTCDQMGATTTCRTTADPMVQMQQQQRDLENMMARQQQQHAQQVGRIYAWQDVQPTPCTSLQRYAYSESPSYCAARQVATNRKAVGDLIAAGQCGDALKGALGTGDLQFAREVRDFCGAK